MIPDGEKRNFLNQLVDNMLYRLGLVRLSTVQWMFDNPSEAVMNETKVIGYETLLFEIARWADGECECIPTPFGVFPDEWNGDFTKFPGEQNDHR